MISHEREDLLKKRYAILGGLAAATAAAWYVNKKIAAPRYRGPRTPHFDGHRFENLEPFRAKTTADIIKWQAARERGTWPEWIDIPRRPAPPRDVTKGWRATFVNHASVLIQVPGVNILTDPVWSDRVGPTPSLGAPRHKAPGVDFDQLPPIDVVLISHAHFDHFDVPTLTELAREHDPLFVCGLGVGQLLARYGITRSIELDWWDHITAGPLSLTFTPAQHWSARGLGDRNANLWGGFFIKAHDASIYFVGDTGDGDHFAEIAARLGAPDLALIPIGAYAPRWFMADQHIDPAQAVRAHETLGAARSMAIHWGTFALADDGHDDPLIELARAKQDKNLTDADFIAIDNGEHIESPG